MVQLANRMNHFEDVDFYLAAVNQDFSHRGPHWGDTIGNSDKILYYKGSIALLEWLKQVIYNIQPDIVYTGINKGPVYELLVAEKITTKYLLGKWNEPYMS